MTNYYIFTLITDTNTYERHTRILVHTSANQVSVPLSRASALNRTRRFAASVRQRPSRTNLAVYAAKHALTPSAPRIWRETYYHETGFLRRGRAPSARHHCQLERTSVRQPYYHPKPARHDRRCGCGAWPGKGGRDPSHDGEPGCNRRRIRRTKQPAHGCGGADGCWRWPPLHIKFAKIEPRISFDVCSSTKISFHIPIWCNERTAAGTAPEESVSGPNSGPLPRLRRAGR